MEGVAENTGITGGLPDIAFFLYVQRSEAPGENPAGGIFYLL